MSIISKPKPPVTFPEEFIEYVNYDGLRGRIITLPANNKRHSSDLVLISGQHSAHERSQAFGEFLRDFGTVHLIDLPGFGGMDSFVKAGKPISYDSYAEYLYTVLKSRGLTNNVTIFAVSIGSQFVTRMYQRFPKTQGWVDKNIAFVGFGAAKDFQMPWLAKTAITTLAIAGSTRLSARIIGTLFFNRFCLVLMMEVFSFVKRKMQSEDPAQAREMVAMEKYLWFTEDKYTHAKTTLMMFRQDLRQFSSAPITVELHNVLTSEDQYFNIKEVRKTFRDLYNNYHEHSIVLDMHMPSMLSSKDQVRAMFDDETIAKISP